MTTASVVFPVGTITMSRYKPKKKKKRNRRCSPNSRTKVISIRTTNELYNKAKNLKINVSKILHDSLTHAITILAPKQSARTSKRA